MKDLDTQEIGTGDAPAASVIWLHGLGADGHDFEPIVPQLRLPETLPLRFVFPHAPMRAVTINNGMVMRAWYDITGLEMQQREDESGIVESAALVSRLINREIRRGIPADRIVLAGFSQGGAIALHAGLRFPETLAGIMGLSCYLPMGRRLDAEASPANRNTAIFMAHGTLDPVIPIQLGKLSCEHLRKCGFSVEWTEYVMAHAVCPEEIADISAWLQTRLFAFDEAGRG